MNNKKATELIETLSQFDRENFQEFEYSEIKASTTKAILFCGEKWEQWIPISQLRVDDKENILVANWLYDKIFPYEGFYD